MSATGTSLLLKECGQTLKNWRCVNSGLEVPIFTRFEVFPFNAPS